LRKNRESLSKTCIFRLRLAYLESLIKSAVLVFRISLITGVIGLINCVGEEKETRDKEKAQEQDEEPFHMTPSTSR
jgi:hypothetical protein